jgi:glycosyltransferase involved in cell wall biosynthesis
MGSATGLRIGLDIGWLGASGEGIRHWTMQTFRALIRDNPRHHFTLIWPWFSPDSEVVDALSGPNTDLLVFHPQNLLRKVGRRLGLFDDTRRVVRRVGGLDVAYASLLAETSIPWLRLTPQVPKVFSLFDATPLATPEYHVPGTRQQFEKYLADTRAVNGWWLTISEHARQDLIARAGVDPARGRVVYPGHNFDETAGQPTAAELPGELKARLGGHPYVLTVGTLEPRKNHVRLFRAFRALVDRPEFADWKLVAVGREGWLCDEIVAEAERTPGVVLAGRLGHDELAATYRHAAVFAYPSLYEGFGLPVVEAMSFGLPVVSSNVSSMPEAAGPVGLLVDPTDEGQIGAALARLMADPEERARLGAAGREHARRFSWANAARETMAFLEEVARAG